MYTNVNYPSKFWRVGFVLVAVIAGFFWYAQPDPIPTGNTISPFRYEQQIGAGLPLGVVFFLGLVGTLISNSLFKVPANHVAFHQSGSVYHDGWKFLPFCGIASRMSVASPSQRVMNIVNEKTSLRNGTKLLIDMSIAWKPDETNLAPFMKASEGAINGAIGSMVQANLTNTAGNYEGTWRDFRAEQSIIEKRLSAYDDTPSKFGVVMEYVRLTKIETQGRAATDPEPVEFTEKFNRARAKLRQLRELRKEAEDDGSSAEEIDILDHLIEAEKAKLKESL